MNIVLILLVSVVMLTDFIKLKKDSKKKVIIYLGITMVAIIISMADRYEVFKDSPLEVLIEKMTPITQKIENSLK